MRLVERHKLCLGCLTPGHSQAVKSGPHKDACTKTAAKPITIYCTWKGARPRKTARGGHLTTHKAAQVMRQQAGLTPELGGHR
jgi:hypothetical protein